MSDRAGRSAVIFPPVLERARQLWKAGKLRYVDDRTSFGLGDYQVFHLTSQTCSTALRGQYRDPYTWIAPAPTSLLSELSLRYGAVPDVIQGNERVGVHSLKIRFLQADGAMVAGPLTLRGPGGSARSAGTEAVGTARTSCHAVAAFDEMTKRNFAVK